MACQSSLQLFQERHAVTDGTVGRQSRGPRPYSSPPSYDRSSPVRYVHQLLCIEPVAIHCWCVHCQWRLLLITMHT